MATLRKCLPPNVMEMIAMILGDTNNGLTGTEIHRLLLQSNIDDVDGENTKRNDFLMLLQKIKTN